MTIQEEKVYKTITEGLTYHPEEKKFEATYPFIKDPNNLPNNKEIIKRIFHSNERRLMKSESKAKQYNEQIIDMLRRGVFREVTQEELDAYKGPVFYISHHAVFKPESRSTPCRIVFNASANNNGHRLNDYFAKGPKLLNDLLGLLLRF